LKATGKATRLVAAGSWQQIHGADSQYEAGCRPQVSKRRTLSVHAGVPAVIDLAQYYCLRTFEQLLEVLALQNCHSS